jgi:hypothetical protein
MAQVAPGMFLAVKMELKTQDSKGRTVGKTHGKQKHYAEAEEWYIARSPEQINLVLLNIEKALSAVKKSIKEGVTVLNPSQTDTFTLGQAMFSPGYIKPKQQPKFDVVHTIGELIDTKLAIESNFNQVALQNIDEIIERLEAVKEK